MMKCHEVRRYLDLFMDSEMSVPEIIRVLEHLGLCRDCDQIYKAEEGFRALLKGTLGAVDAPPGLEARIARALT